MKKVQWKSLLLGGLCAGVLGLIGCSDSGEELKKVSIAEPAHLTGYLPLYLAISEGYFEEEGLEVEVVTAAGGAHVTTLVSGEVWANIAGPDSNELANDGSSDPIVAVANVVNRANVYLMAEKGTAPADDSEEALAEFFKGKNIAASRYGGSPNLLTRSLLIDLGIDLEQDVTLEEPADVTAVLALVEQGTSQIANGAEPTITEGMNKGVWEEPFFGFPSLGDYPYSVISVKQSTIDEEAEDVEGFVKAILRGLETVYEDPELAEEVLRAEFPSLSDEQIEATQQRAYTDEHWSKDGIITEEALAKTMEVLKKTGIYDQPYSYEDMVDMQFVEE
ncbi:ABC transporter substrate-binding protein [Alkalicoccobacillus porphyridii]|uniref:ABC transporter substrate-binding protein n=1 Tax=Alkalicoccobacillus porphyridii TaxID=2597270 RepID=A0A554A1K3_9BACI|nr:ABC transporter substrate-binding protein [Alkalicoccobacillus porphyridii]TSB47572.1 ABC transporter substrate-binding protein [Alkalicoccobacillus porphyridii]